MTPNQYYNSHTREQSEKVAVEAGTNLNNFKLIALYGGSVSKRLAHELEKSSKGEMTTLEILFPEKYEAA